MTLSAGIRLGPYEIQSALGAGGMGEVYRARDTRLDRDVAVKVLPAVASADPERLRRFEQEARAAAALNHPNILAVYDIGVHDGAPYIVSELLEGESLRAAIRTGVSVRKAVDYAVQMAHGLAAAHDKGIVHRDLKPDNVFVVTTHGHVKILDFGLAKLTEAAHEAVSLSQAMTAAPTEPGLALGTLGYMAPEQLRGQTVDHRADLFALGAVLYEMLSGQRAFPGTTGADAIGEILNKVPAELPLGERKIPPGLARIVDRCLEKQPAARFQTAADLAFALEALLASATSSEVAGQAAARGDARAARPAWLIAGVSVLATLLVGVPAALYLQPAAPEPIVTRLDVVTPPTPDAFSFALSPDGRQLVFVATGDRGPQLWLRRLDEVAAQALAGTEGATYPFWAPDSRTIGFFAEGKLKRVNLSGGAPQVLADAPQGRGGTWNNDDVIVFTPVAVGPLFAMKASGGTPTVLTRLATGHTGHRWPQFLPDGRRVLFSVFSGRQDVSGVYLFSLDGGDGAEPARVLLTEAAGMYALPGHLLHVSQGALIAQPFDVERETVAGEPVVVAQGVGQDDGTLRSAFSVSAAGILAHRPGAPARRNLVWASRTGTMLGSLGSTDEGSAANPALAPDGRRVAFNRTIQGNVDIWLMDAARGVLSRFTFDAGIDARPVWSPDGTRLVFQSTRKGINDLYEKPASGATEEQPLLTTPQNKAPLDWSLDGRFLLYSSQGTGAESDLWVLPLTADRKPISVVQSRFDEIEGQFSPDGRWIAYASNESGRYEVYVQTFPESGGKWQVSAAGGAHPRWRRDGQELYYVAPDNRLMAA
ncbi:MAG: protein kinase domain-containing protein, partial [Vicinamibacterales bacterium]